MCGKESFDTYELAKRILNAINHRNKNTRGKKLENVYKCNICEKFHTTSQVKNRKRKNYK